MVEPIGLTGTLIGVVQVSCSIVQSCYEYYKTVKDAPHDISRILDEGKSLRDIAERLVDLTNKRSHAALPSLRALNNPSGPLETWLKELTELAQLLEPRKNKWRRFILEWPLTKLKAETLLATMERIKGTLQLALAADSVHNIDVVISHTKTLPGIQHDVSGLVKHVDSVRQDEDIAEALRLLHGNVQESKQREEYEKCIAGTGEWLVSHETYTEWKAEPGQLLWLHGISGCGKTILCSKVIEDLRAHCEADSTRSLCYFFLNGADQRPANLEAIYRSFVSQLVCQRTYQREEQFRSLRFRLKRAQGGPTLMSVLEAILGGQQCEFDHNYIVIDALDECEDSSVLDAIVQSMSKLVGSKKRRVHLIAFSRRLERLQTAFTSLNAYQIAIEGKDSSNDLRTALRARLSRGKFNQWRPALKKTIETTLLSQANGCFRWLVCQLQDLEHCATPGAVKDAVEQLPKSLEAHYSRVLEKIDVRNQASVRSLLRWVTFACRPLSIEELAEAITINAEAGDVPFVDEDLELFDVESFLDSCSSLVSVHCGPTDVLGSQEQYVQLAHYSVKEFLVSIDLRGSYSSFALNERLAQACLATSCLAYFLQTVNHDSDEFWDLNPFARYAGQFWTRHEQIAPDGRTSIALRALGLDLFDEGRPYFRTWLKVADIDRPWASGRIQKKDEEMDKYTPLYCAAWYGLEYVTDTLLARGSSPDGSCGLYGNALQAAANNGHLSVVKLLLNVKTDVDASGGRYHSAIAAAAAHGHVDVVRELLAAGAEAQPQRRRFGDRRTDPLFLAVKSGSLETVKLLLVHGAEDYITMKAIPASALDAATQDGRVDMVKELLNHEQTLAGNSMRAGCDQLIRSAASGFSASQYSAAARGHIDILRELSRHEMSLEERLRYAARAGDLTVVLQCLEEGAGINADGDVADHPRAIESAAMGGHMAVFRELLARGAMPDSDTLIAAIRAKSLEMVQILVDAGVNINVELGYPPFSEAVDVRRWDIVEFLASRGAEMHKTLEEVVVRGNDEGFEQLIRLGANLHHQEPKSAPLLQVAARGGSVKIVKYLLESGMGPDPPQDGPKLTTALMEAIRSKSWEAMHLLLDHGAEVNATPPLTSRPSATGGWYCRDLIWPPAVAYETPLTMAARTGYQDACFELIRRGAFITADTPITAGTPLLYAVWEGLPELMDHLLREGADPNRQGTILDRDKPSTPLLLAAEKLNLGAVHRLIAAGARVDDQDAEGFSPLHLAAAAAAADRGKKTDMGDTDVLSVLIHQYKAKINGPRLLNGSQPIHSAAAKGTVEHVRILLDAGADMNALNDDGRTPLHWAAEKGKWDVVELFVDRGADAWVRSKDESLQTPLELADAARTLPLWRVDKIEGWDDERIDALLIRLEKAETGK